jgi:hypothetical protein
MERPVIKDKKVLAYVQDLERQLSNFKSEETNARLYLGVKRQLDDMATLLFEDIEVPNPETGEIMNVKFMDFQTLSSKDDKFVDRFMKIMDKFKEYMKDLKEAEELINPAVVEKVEKKVSGSVADSFVFGDGKSKA